METALDLAILLTLNPLNSEDKEGIKQIIIDQYLLFPKKKIKPHVWAEISEYIDNNIIKTCCKIFIKLLNRSTNDNLSSFNKDFMKKSLSFIIQKGHYENLYSILKEKDICSYYVWRNIMNSD